MFFVKLKNIEGSWYSKIVDLLGKISKIIVDIIINFIKMPL